MTSIQLPLDPDDHWRLDEHTRRIGREGIARARAALAAHPPVASWPEAA